MAIGLAVALLLAIGWGFTYYHSNKQKKHYNSILEETVNQRTTQLQQVNHDLDKMNKTLQQANYELRTFNYIASHDIKEPIRNISSYVGLINRKLPADLKSSLSEYFQTIKSSTTQLYTLVEDFAKYTSLSKEETVKQEVVDLNQLLVGIEHNFSEMIKEQSGHINYNNLPTIHSSASLLYTIFKNLIENKLS